MKLVLLRRFSDADQRFLAEQLKPHYTLMVPEDFSPPVLAEALAEAHVVLGETVGRALIDIAPYLRLIHTPGTSVGGIDLAAATERGIAVCCSHSSAPLVAEHAVALLLSLTRRIPLHDRAVRAGLWFRPAGRPEDRELLPVGLDGRTVGLLGFGHIGRRVAQLLAPFGCRLLAYSRSRAGHDGGVTLAGLDEVLSGSDAVVVSLPLTEATRGLLDTVRLARLPAGAFVVNVGRAAVIDESALFAALTGGHLGGAALDVWWEEPAADADGAVAPSRRHPFHILDNVVLSPHRAATEIGGARHLHGVVETLLRFARDGMVPDTVTVERGY